MLPKEFFSSPLNIEPNFDFISSPGVLRQHSFKFFLTF